MRSVLLALLVPVFQAPAAEIIASGELPANTVFDHQTIAGIGSGITYDAKDDVYICVSDRGPNDGKIPYRPRFVKLKITQEGDKLNLAVQDAVIFKDENGQDMTGLIPTDDEADTPRMKDGRTCIDPEAIAFSKDGRLYVTDEYGPYLYQFGLDGKMIRRFPVPAEFQPKTESGKVVFTDREKIATGRTVNQGPEGMCLLPDEKHAALIFQSALQQDGGRNAGTTKILILDLATGQPTAVYQYNLSPEVAGIGPKELSINDMQALDDNRFLVLERDGHGRDGGIDPHPAKYKSVWLADVSKATNLLNAPDTKVPVPAAKQLLFNLCQLVPEPKTLAAKWEGIVVIPPSNDKDVTLLMTADNDFKTPDIYDNFADGKPMPFLPKDGDAVPTQIFKIRAKLPKNP